MDTSNLTPEMFKQQILAAHPGSKDSKGVSYSDIPADELLDRFLAKNPNAKTSKGIPYSAYKGTTGNKSSGNLLFSPNDTSTTIKNIGSDLQKRGQNAVNIAETNADLISKGATEPGLQGFGNVLKGIFGAGVQQTGNVAGAVGDMFSEVLSTIIKKNPEIGDKLSAATTAFMNMKNPLGETNAQTISKLQAIEAKHPEIAKDVISALNIGSLLLGEKGAPETKTAEEGATEGIVKPGEEATGAQPKTPGIRATLTPVEPDVKTSFKKVLDSFGGNTTKAKQWFTDLFATEKGKVLDTAADSPVAQLANEDLTTAQTKIKTNIDENVKLKDNTIAKFGDTKVTGFTENGKTTSMQDIFNNFKNLSDKLQKTKVVLTSGQATTYQRFLYGLQELSQKGTLKDVDAFVDTWQDSKLGSGGQNADQLESIINSTLHDVNESAKTAADSVDGGAYRKANSELTKLYKVKNDLEAGLRDKGAYTGKYAGAANFYAKAAGGDSIAKAQLEDIEQATGIPLQQKSNIAQFVQDFGKKKGITDILTDLPPLLFAPMGAKRTLYRDLISWIGDPEGAGIQILNKLDKTSNGGMSKTIDGLTSQIEGDSKAMAYLKNAGLNAKQGAGILLLGQLNSTSDKKNSQ